jgi:small subunit ribosomal protein S12
MFKLMSTIGLIKNPKQRRAHKSKAPALKCCPQKRAIVIKSFETTPRKPNSAKRRVAKVRLSNRRTLNVYLEGMSFNKLQPHSVVLVRGRGPRDLPGVRYHAIRGVLDFPPLMARCKGRSKYGTKQRKSTEVKKFLDKFQKYRFLQYSCKKNQFYRS